MAEQREAALDALLQEERVLFAGRLVAKMQELEALIARGEWAEARRAAHKLRGSAGVYGFGALSVSAAAIEQILSRTGNAAGAQALLEIREKLGEMSVEVKRASREAR